MSQLGPFFLPLSSWSMGLVTCTTYNYTNSIQFSSRRYIMLFCAQTCLTELQHVKESQLGEETQGAQTANQQPLAFFSHLRWSKGKWKGRQSPQNTSTLLIPMWGKSSKGEESLKISMGFPWWREFSGQPIMKCAEWLAVVRLMHFSIWRIVRVDVLLSYSSVAENWLVQARCPGFNSRWLPAAFSLFSISPQNISTLSMDNILMCCLGNRICYILHSKMWNKGFM